MKKISEMTNIRKNMQCGQRLFAEQEEKVGRRFDIPLWEKYTLSIEEASKYFRIGEHKLRNLVNENQDADWILWNASRAQIKRKKFERFIDSISNI